MFLVTEAILLTPSYQGPWLPFYEFFFLENQNIKENFNVITAAQTKLMDSNNTFISTAISFLLS